MKTLWSKKAFIFLIFSCYFQIQFVLGYPNGAPIGACPNLSPQHNAEPQKSQNPFKIELGQETENHGFNITLTSKNNRDTFLGFMVQVRKYGSDNATGRFSSDNYVKIISCGDGKDNTATHTSSDPKMHVTLEWFPTTETQGEFEIVYTVVGPNGQVFWSNQKHNEKIRLKSQNPGQQITPVQRDSRLLRHWKGVYEGCGTTKGCFGMPGHCIDEYRAEDKNPITCEMMVTWKRYGDKNEFQLTGRPGTGNNGYVAVGFSLDNKMGKDSVVGCVLTEQAGLRAERSYNPAQYNDRHPEHTLGLVNTGASVLEGNYFCNFTQTNHDLAPLLNYTVDFDNQSYYLLLSKANSVKEANLGRHAVDDKGCSPKSVKITDMLKLQLDSKPKGTPGTPTKPVPPKKSSASSLGVTFNLFLSAILFVPLLK